MIEARVEVASRAELRDWLNGHHEQGESIWLVTFKKAAGSNYLPYAEIVEEALCFGWIDSLPRALDAERTMLRLSPRKPGSAWSAPNRERADRLIAKGRMTAAGLAKIEAAKADGSWDRLKAAEAGVLPDDLAAALREAGAEPAFADFSDAVKRRCIEFVEAAKCADTRARRVAKIVAGAKAGADPLSWRRKGER